MFAARGMHWRTSSGRRWRAANGWCAIASPMPRAPTRERARRRSGLHRAARRTPCIADLQPDCTLLLDLPVAVGLARARSRAGAATDRFEAETAAFFERVRAGYLELARREPRRFDVIDAAVPLAAGRGAGGGRFSKHCGDRDGKDDPALAGDARETAGERLRRGRLPHALLIHEAPGRAGSGSRAGRRSWCCATHPGNRPAAPVQRASGCRPRDIRISCG